MLACVACGRVGFDPLAGDAVGVDAVPTIDAQTLIPIVELNSGDLDDDPTLTADLLEICFSSTRAGGLGAQDVWCAVRSDPTGAWEAPTNVAVVNSAMDETTPELSLDGLTLYIGRGTPASSDNDIFVSTRASRGAAWSVPTVVAELSSPVYDGSPAPVSDVALYLQSDRAGNRDLFLAQRASAADPWGAPQLVDGANSADSESDAFGNAALTVLYFARDPYDETVRDIYVAMRADPALPFDTPAPMDALNSSANDSDPWVPADESFIIFSSTRDDGAGDLYLSQMY